MKQNIVVILILISLFGCSAKNSASKNGAILGTTAGAMAGGVMGLAISATKSEQKDFTKNALIGAVVVGVIGYLTGSAMGYVFDEVGNRDTKEIEKIVQSDKMLNKSLKQKPIATPEAINNAQISNGVSTDNRILDIETEVKVEEAPNELNLLHTKNIVTQEMSVVDISSGTVSPIEPTEIQSDNEEVTVDKQENETLW